MRNVGELLTEREEISRRILRRKGGELKEKCMRTLRETENKGKRTLRRKGGEL